MDGFAFEQLPAMRAQRNAQLAAIQLLDLRMTNASVPVELHVYPGGPHGFDGLLPGTQLARRARKDMEEWLARTFAAALPS